MERFRKVVLGVLVVYAIIINLICFSFMAKSEDLARRIQAVESKAQQEIGSLRAVKQRLEEVNSSSALERIKLVKKRDSLNEEINKLKRDLKNTLVRHAALEKEKVQLTAKTKQLEQEKSGLIVRTERKEEEIRAELRDKIAGEFRKQVSDLQRQLTDVRDLMARAQVERDAAVGKLQRTKSELATLQGKNIVLDRENSSLQVKLKKAHVAKEQVQAETKELHKNIIVLTRERNSLSGNLKEETKQKERLQSEFLTTRDVLEKVNKQVTGLKTDNRQLTGQVIALEKNLKEEHQKVTTLNDKLGETEGKYQDLTRKHTRVLTRNEVLEEIVADHDKTLAREQKEKNKYYKELQKVKSANGVLTNDQAVLTQRSAKLEKDLTGKKKAYQAEKSAHAQTEEKLAGAEVKISELRQDLVKSEKEKTTALIRFKKAQDKSAKFSDAFSKVSGEKDTALEQLRDTTERLTSIQRSFKESEAERNRLEKSLSETNNEKANLTKERDQLSENLDKARFEYADLTRLSKRLEEQLVLAQKQFKSEQIERVKYYEKFKEADDEVTTLTREKSYLGQKEVRSQKVIDSLSKTIQSERVNRLKAEEELARVQGDNSELKQKNAVLTQENNINITRLQENKDEINLFKKALIEETQARELSILQAESLDKKLTTAQGKITLLESQINTLTETRNVETAEKMKLYNLAKEFEEKNRGLTYEKQVLTDQKAGLETQYTNLEATLITAREEKTKYINDLQKTRDEMNVLARDKTDLEDKNKGFKRKLANLKNDLEIRRVQIDEYAKKLSTSEDKGAELTRTNTSLEAELKRVQTNQAGLETKYTNLEATLITAREEKTKYINDLQKTRDEMNVLARDKTNLEDKNKGVERKLANLKNDLETRRTQIDEYVGKLYASEDKMSELNRINTSLEAEFKRVQTDRAALKKELQAKQGKVSEYDIKLQEATAEVQHLKKTLQSESKEKETYKEQLKETRTTNTTLENNLSSLQKELELAEETKTELGQKLTQVEEQRLSLKNRWKKESETRRQYANEIVKLELERETLKSDKIDLDIKYNQALKEIGTLPRDLEQAKQVRDKAENDLKTVQGEINRLNKEIKNLITQNKQQGETIDGFGSKVAELRKDLRKVTAQKDEISNQWEMTQDKLGVLFKEITRLGRLNATAEKTITKREGEIKKLRTDNAKGQDEITALSQKKSGLEKTKNVQTKQINALQITLKNKENELENILKSSKADRQRYESQSKKNKEQIDVLSKENTELKEDNTKFTKDIALVEKKLKKQDYELNKIIRKERDEKIQALTDLNAFKEAGRKLSRQVSELSIKLDFSEQNVDRFKEAIKELETDMSGGLKTERDKNALLTRQLEDASKKVRVFEKVEIDLSSKLMEKERALAVLKTKWYEELEKTTKEMQTEYESMLQEARTKIDRAQKIVDKTKKDAHYNLGLIYTKAKMFNEAIEAYLSAKAIDPKDKDIYYNLGIVYDEYKDRPEQAVICYDKYLELAPADDSHRAKVQLWRDNCLRRMKEGGREGFY